MSLPAIIIWAAVVVIFAIAWRKGYLVKLANYVGETREELKKCTWPTLEELKGSTMLVAVTIALLGVFTVVVDFVFVHVMLWVSKA